jgi:uncharacterized short protein YbdD (DUF466 family)
MKAFGAALWSFLRAWSGDSAYDTYALRQRALGRAALSREEFYLETLDRRYKTITRCC